MARLPLIILNTLLLLGLLEGVARFAEWRHPVVEDVSFDYAPYRMLRMTRAPWALNSDGFRAAELLTYRANRNDKFLIEFLGGSVCLGVGTNPGKIVPERLEEALRAAGLKQVTVLNLCQGGAPSAQELAIFLQYGLPLKPEMVLSFNGANDLMHPLPLGEDAAPNLPYHDREMKALFEGHHGVLAHLALARVAGRLVRRLPAPTATTGHEVPVGDIVESYLYTTDIVRTLTEAEGGGYAVLLQPTLHYAKPWSEAERKMWRERRPSDFEATSKHASDLYVAARSGLSKWSERTAAPVYDLTNTFQSTSNTIYSDSVHFTGEAGYRMLTDELERQGLMRAIESRYRQWEQKVRTSSADQVAHIHAARNTRSLPWQP